MTRLVGTLTLATGSGLLLSGPFLGRDLLIELVGEGAASLRLICIIAIVLGLLAVALGIRDERETKSADEGEAREKVSHPKDSTSQNWR